MGSTRLAGTAGGVPPPTTEIRLIFTIIGLSLLVFVTELLPIDVTAVR